MGEYRDQLTSGSENSRAFLLRRLLRARAKIIQRALRALWFTGDADRAAVGDEAMREVGPFLLWDQHVHEELGDLLFTIANIARKLNVNAEDALQSANRKFSRRFESMESKVRSGGQNLDDLTLEQTDGLWDEAKAAERA